MGAVTVRGVAVHVGDAVVVGALRAAAARGGQGAVLRGAEEVPRLPERAGGARGGGRARVPRQHQPPPAGGDGDPQVHIHTPMYTCTCSPPPRSKQ